MPKNKKDVIATDESHQEPTSAPILSAKDLAAHGIDHPASVEEEIPSQDDSEIDKAIDEITTSEADEVLAAEDAELAKAFDPKTEPTGLKARIKSWARAWWNNKKLRYGTFAGLAVFIILAAAIPQSRYFVLNNVGIRSTASVVIIDSSTQQPLKNVEVTLANQTAKTDENGKATVSHIKLGATTLTVYRRAFAPVDKKVVVGWGSNPLGGFALKPTGTQYTFSIKDFMSSKAIEKAQVNAGDADAVADKTGLAVLTIDPGETGDLTATIKAEGYKDITMPLDLDDRSMHSVDMVPAQKHAFVSKRSGKYDLYVIDADGSNEKVLLSGTGNERDGMSVVSHPSANIVALVSSRDNVRNKDGYLLANLNIIDVNTGQRTPVTQSEDIHVIDWIGDKIIFVQVAAGASASNPKRQRLVSYDYKTNSQKELASSNYFYDVVSAGGNIYYSTSDNSQEHQAAFYKVTPEGTGRVTLLNKQVWNIFRTKYDHLTLAADQTWYDLKIGDVTTTKMSGAPASQENRVYQDDSTRKNSLWVDSRDGKGVLLKHDVSANEDTVLRTQSGLTSPVYWLNDHYVVYRIHTDQETADYVLNIDGGQPRKISDVTSTAGLGQWYYY